MGYTSTQKGPWAAVLGGVTVLLVVQAFILRDKPLAVAALVAGALSLAVLAGCFHRLTLRDEGDRLGIRFGPLPFFRRTISYKAIRSVKAGRSSFIDGWGIHYIPWRGWTYNLWGYGCVILDVEGKTIRVGVPDPEALVDFLRSRTDSRRA